MLGQRLWERPSLPSQAEAHSAFTSRAILSPLTAPLPPGQFYILSLETSLSGDSSDLWMKHSVCPCPSFPREG